jgi:hypothetical protein
VPLDFAGPLAGPAGGEKLTPTGPDNPSLRRVQEPSRVGMCHREDHPLLPQSLRETFPLAASVVPTPQTSAEAGLARRP